MLSGGVGSGWWWGEGGAAEEGERFYSQLQVSCGKGLEEGSDNFSGSIFSGIKILYSVFSASCPSEPGGG